MVSVFLVNDAAVPFKNPSKVTVSMEGTTAGAERSDSGDIISATRVNCVGKIVLEWDYLTVADMEALCTLFGLNVVNVGERYTPKTLNEMLFNITLRLPCGVRTITCYVGDSLSGELADHSGNPDPSTVGGEYWTNISLSLVGTGEGWNVQSAT